jgi:hypothetical protein
MISLLLGRTMMVDNMVAFEDPLAGSGGKHVGLTHRESPPRAQHPAAGQKPLTQGRCEQVDLTSSAPSVAIWLWRLKLSRTRAS